MGKFYNPTPAQILAFIKLYFPDYKTRKNGTEVEINNPFNDDTGRHLGISLTKLVCHDFRSDDWAGPVNPETGKRNTWFLNFVCRFLHCSFRDAIRAVSRASGDTVPVMPAGNTDGQSECQEEAPVALPDGAEPINGSEQKTMARLVSGWLNHRGVDRQAIIDNNLYHLGSDVIFPYYEYGQIVYWQSRSAINKVFRFPDQSKTRISKGQFLYGFDSIEPVSYIIIVEAIFGCYSLIDQCLASGGADLTDTQVRKLKLIGPKDGIILAPDNDVAGIKSIISNGKKLSKRGFSVFYSLPTALPYTDKDGIKKYLKDWNEAITELGMNKSEIRLMFENNIKPLNEAAKVKLLGSISVVKQR